MVRIVAALAFAAVLLAGCANPWNSMNFPPGTPMEEVSARAGPPARVWPLPNGGERLQYTLMPTGYYAFMADFGPDRRLVQVRQVMKPSEFLRIQDNAWTREDIEREFGPPARIDTVASWHGPIYTYRWYEPGQGPMFWYVYFDPQGVVRKAHPGIEFINGPNDRN